jgi:ATP-dependent protease ClpP protease subunit
MPKTFPALIAAAVILLQTAAVRAEHIVLNDRMVTLEGAISTKAVGKAVKAILQFDAESHEPIWLQINSFGGSVEAGFVFIDTIKNIKSPIYSVVTSKAYSMAAIIAIYCDKRYIYPHATMMFHEASYGALGEDPTIRSRMQFNSRYLDRLHAEIAGILKMPLKKYRSRIRDAWWAMADEAVRANFADAVVTRISYKKINKETVEIKRSVIKKQQRMVRPKTKNGDGVSFSD